MPGGPGNCRGYIPGAPQQIIQTPTGFNFLRIIAQPLAGTDLTLMVRGTSQTWCADDTYGNMPGLDLRGGLRLVYTVEVEEAIRDKRDRYADEISRLTGATVGEAPAVAAGTTMVPVAPPR